MSFLGHFTIDRDPFLHGAPFYIETPPICGRSVVGVAKGKGVEYSEGARGGGDRPQERATNKPHLAKSLPELTGLLSPFACLRAPTPAYGGFIEPSRRCLRLGLTAASPSSASGAAGVGVFGRILF